MRSTIKTLSRLAILGVVLAAAPGNAEPQPTVGFGQVGELGGGGTFSTDLTLENDEFISNATDGKITLGGSGGTNNEDLTIDFETLSNQAIFASSTGVSTFNFTGRLYGSTGAYVGASGNIYFSGRSQFVSPADGQITIRNAANTSGATLDVDDAADTIVVKDQAGTAAGSIALLVGGQLQLDSDGSDYLVSNGSSISMYANNTLHMVLGATATSFRRSTGLYDDFGHFFGTGDDQYLYYTDGTGVRWNDGTNDVITVPDDSNQVNIGALTSLTGGAVLPVQTSATPSAPATCDASAKGRIEVVDDSDDGAGTQVCYCGMTDDSTYDWLNIADNTACTFY